MVDPANRKRRNLKDYFFSYSWRELAAVRDVRDTWVLIYAIFAVAGLLLDPLQDGPRSAFCAGAIANYPGYLLGVWRQRQNEPDALESSELMVWQIGNVAIVLCVVGVLLLAQALLRS